MRANGKNRLVGERYAKFLGEIILMNNVILRLNYMGIVILTLFFTFFDENLSQNKYQKSNTLPNSTNSPTTENRREIFIFCDIK